MSAILTSLRNTIIAGFVLAILIVVLVTGTSYDYGFYLAVMRYLHVLSGVMWIGLLWYFNFVQIPNMPNIPDEQKPAIGKVIAPAALFWFRWGAMATLITGLILAHLNGYLVARFSLARKPVKPRLSASGCGSESLCGQRLVCDLAKSEKSSGHCGGGR